MYLCLFLSKWHFSWGEVILKSPTIIELCLDCILKSSSRLFMKWGMLEFNTFMFGIVMSSGLSFALIKMKYSSLSLWINFSFNSGFLILEWKLLLAFWSHLLGIFCSCHFTLRRFLSSRQTNIEVWVLSPALVLICQVG